MPDETTKIFVCFESHYQACAERLNAWTHTNHDKAFYNRRVDVPVESAAAESIKRVLREQIQEAQVTVCLISQTTSLDDWIAWELETSKTGPDRNGLVGVILRDHGAYPPALVNSGTMFVPFKHDSVEAAIEWALTEHDTSEDFTLEDD
ncbi:MAG: TIR domain-containing protein [Phycisphaerae bacterium]